MLLGLDSQEGKSWENYIPTTFLSLLWQRNRIWKNIKTEFKQCWCPIKGNIWFYPLVENAAHHTQLSTAGALLLCQCCDRMEKVCVGTLHFSCHLHHWELIHQKQFEQYGCRCRNNVFVWIILGVSLSQ